MFDLMKQSETSQKMTDKTTKLATDFKQAIGSYDYKKFRRKNIFTGTTKFISLYDACVDFYNITYNVSPIIEDFKELLSDLDKEESELKESTIDYSAKILGIEDNTKEMLEEIEVLKTELEKLDAVKDYYDHFEISDKISTLESKIDNFKVNEQVVRTQQLQASAILKTNRELRESIFQLVDVGYPMWSKLTNQYIDSLSLHNKLIINEKLNKNKSIKKENNEKAQLIFEDIEEENTKITDQIDNLLNTLSK